MVITNCAVAEHSGPAFDTKPVECYILHVAVADRKSPRLEGAARDRVSLHHAVECQVKSFPCTKKWNASVAHILKYVK